MAEDESVPPPSLASYGERLFQAVFHGDVLSRLETSLTVTAQAQEGLRIRLRFSDVPALLNLPWEYLFDAKQRQFLALSKETPIVRYQDLPQPIQPLFVQIPLRILVMIAVPTDYPTLDVETEYTKLEKALADLIQQNQITIERVQPATLDALQRHLQKGQYHVFHFIGHGGIEPQADGTLVLENESKRGRRVSGSDLGTILRDHRSLRLAVLNACEGARSSEQGSFTSVAQSLLSHRIPAIIAMQSPIADSTAILLAEEFYRCLAQSYPVDAALTEARRAIFSRGNTSEWGIPVLYMRAPDGRIFTPAQRRRSTWYFYALIGIIALAVGVSSWLGYGTFDLPAVTLATNPVTISSTSEVSLAPTGLSPTSTAIDADRLQVGIAQFSDCISDEVASALVAEIEKSVSILTRITLTMLEPIVDAATARQQTAHDLIIWGQCPSANQLRLTFDLPKPIGPAEVYQPTSITITTTTTVLDRADRLSRALMLYLLADMEAATESFTALENGATDSAERAMLGFLRATSLLFQERYDEAIEVYTTLSQQDLLNAEALLNLGMAQFNQAFAKVTGETRAERDLARRQNLAAAETFTRVISTASDSHLLVLALINRSATHYLWGGDLEIAQADCQQAIDLGHTPASYLCRASVFITQSEKNQGCTNRQLFEQAHLDLAASQNPPSLILWNVWAGHLAWLQYQCDPDGPDAEKYKREVQKFYSLYLDAMRTAPFQLAVDRFFVGHVRQEFRSVAE